MTNKFKSVKLFPVWLSISAVIIIAGIILAFLLGFNTSADVPTSHRIEVRYDTVVTVNEEAEEELFGICEKAFEANGLSVSDEKNYEITAGGVVEYAFTNANVDKLKTAVGAIEEGLKGEKFADAETTVSLHKVLLQESETIVWRSAIGVGALLALVYMTFRFGLKDALTGLVAVLHNTLMTVAILALCRVPVVGTAPVVYCAISAFLTLAVWALVCGKFREEFKTPAYQGLGADEMVEGGMKASLARILFLLAPVALAFALMGLLATSGMTAFFLPAIIPVAVCAYSSLAFTPALYAIIKNKFDRRATKRRRAEGAKAQSVKEND